MKLSKYNRFIHRDGKVLAFNCISCGFAELDIPAFEALRSLNSEVSSSGYNAELDNMLPELQRGRFVIDDEVDEVDSLKVMYNHSKYDTSTLGLTIAPTLACNFRCVYCYEGELEPVVMNAEVQQAIVQLVSRHIKNLRGLGICWYGGEPLLATDVIYNLSDKLIDLCAENDCRYDDASIITNGWFLSREIAERLQECKISRVQVTLDGPPEIHDARRPLKSGKGTFERILDNIAAVADILTVIIRINTDATNLDHILALYELLHERNLLGKVHPYLGQVSAHTEACADIEPNCLDTQSFSKTELEIYEKLRSRGFSISPPYPRFLSVFCGASRSQSYVIDPLGNTYKCWHHIGNEQETVGNLTDDSNQPFQNPRFVKWMALDPFDISECRECEYLPLCSGGCPEYYYHGRHTQSGEPNCVSWRYSIDDVLRAYYQRWQKTQET